MAKVLFRVDSSSTIGFGHLMRCSVLAKRYKKRGFDVFFACQNLKGNANYKVLEEGYFLEVLETKDIDEVINLVNKDNFTHVVIDSYEISYAEEKNIKDNTNINLLCLDDNYKKHYCDEILNHNIYASKDKYKGKVPLNCKIYCGSKYTLLRDEFYGQKIKKESNTVFLAMGGVDSKNLSARITKLISKNLKVNIVTSSSNKNLNELIKLERRNKNVSLFVDSKNIAKLMNECCFAIVTPSVILNELFYFKKPFIAIQTEKNQENFCYYLKEKRFNVIREFNTIELKKKLRKFKC